MPVMLSPGTMATELERPNLRRRAAAWGVYRRRRAACRTRSRVSLLMRARPLSACDAVGSDTPARRATSRRLLAVRARRRGGRGRAEAGLAPPATRRTATPAPSREPSREPAARPPLWGGRPDLSNRFDRDWLPGKRTVSAHRPYRRLLAPPPRRRAIVARDGSAAVRLPPGHVGGVRQCQHGLSDRNRWRRPLGNSRSRTTRTFSSSAAASRV